MSKFEDMQDALEEAEATMRHLDWMAAKLIHMVVGRLRRGYHSDLCALKKELANYDMRDGRWIER